MKLQHHNKYKGSNNY